MTNQAASLFSNVATNKKLPLYDEKTGQTDPKKVADFLNYNNEDVAKIGDVSTKSVRYEPTRIPASVTERFQEIANICELVAEQFNGNIEKTVLWFKLKNPMLGNVSPRDLIRIGRYKKLLQFIMDSRQGHTS